jgi:hypothetical protein
MGRNKKDFQNQIILHRGLTATTLAHVDASGLGLHWTTDPEVAKNFANYGAHRPESGEGLLPHGVVLKGEVSPSDIISENSPEADKVQNELGVQGLNSVEKEITAKPRVKVNNVFATEYKDGKVSKIKYLGNGSTGTSYEL